MKTFEDPDKFTAFLLRKALAESIKNEHPIVAFERGRFRGTVLRVTKKGIQDPPEEYRIKSFMVPALVCALLATSCFAGIQDSPDGVVPLGMLAWVVAWILAHPPIL